ncbi:type II toxin-antitoxin system VapC family toxin [Kocuria sp.]|uniref:type II toxin-antitoxin system VapC family toxin n=1 Tax=Kocuria sp. TaxID=1871328 RepID=UPI0026DF8C5D|nr:type II toxin-antitoxin system VapC family toxin [Kocuria sp.]MDO5619444.1 type II toxin-antitoxin system VapC family toxin [Kocuria sp.]
MTLVVDASAIAELLLRTDRGAQMAGVIAQEHLVAPPHLTVEVVSVLRRWNLSDLITGQEARRALQIFRQLGIHELPAADLLNDVWELRHNTSAYDAMYVALARRLGCKLLTLDARLGKTAPETVMTI